MQISDLAALVATGGAVMVPLLGCSVVSVAVILERLWTFTRAARGAAQIHPLVLDAVTSGNHADALALAVRDPSPLGPIYSAILTARTADATYRDRVARHRHSTAARRLKRYIWLLGTIGSLAPFIGLFGTVLGIIRAFDDMAVAGSGGFAVVAAGISEALIATAGGLLVGVLAIFAYNAFMVRIGNLTAEWRAQTEELLLQCATTTASGSPASGVSPH